MPIISPAKILEQNSHIVPGKLRVTEHFFEVPLNYDRPSADNTIKLFARSARKYEKTTDPMDDSSEKKQLPWLVYLQGGPGYNCRPPNYYPFVNTALDRGYQVLFLDQRGTGLSTPISARTLGLHHRDTDQAQADYLKHFRADSIVKDCEAIRKALTASLPEEKRKWSIIGQSFGGFCVTTYLSFFPEGLREAFTTGGLPPLVDNPDHVYERLYKKVIQRNKAYYQKYPEDVERVMQIVQMLDERGEDSAQSPSGGRLSSSRFLQLGLNLGFHGGIDFVHELVLRAYTELQHSPGFLTREAVAAIEQPLPFDYHLIYSLLHEPCYCQGKSSNWSAERLRKNYSQFDTNKLDQPIYFTGEMIYPFMFDDYAELREVKGAANILAQTDDWPPLYDEAQLAKNEVPVYSAVYMEDMYVDYDLCMETARKIKGCKTLITNQIYHDGLRSKMDDVIRGLFALGDDTID